MKKRTCVSPMELNGNEPKEARVPTRHKMMLLTKRVRIFFEHVNMAKWTKIVKNLDFCFLKLMIIYIFNNNDF